MLLFYNQLFNTKINYVSKCFEKKAEVRYWQKTLSDVKLTKESYFKWF